MPPRTASVSPSPTATTSQASPTPSRSAFLAVVGGPKNTSVSLVASDGTVAATAAVDLAPFRMHTMMSWTSASKTRLYYLNAGSEVRFLAPDGTKGTTTRIALGATEQAGFAVSPDDTRIAVAIFSYTLTPGPPAAFTYNGMRLYVEDLNGGGHHVDIFSSPTVAEFPIGWTSGRLVLAVSEPGCCTKLPINPYDATSYHVADPATALRLASLCGVGGAPEGPVEPVGVMCSKVEPEYLHWDGSPFVPPAAVSAPMPYLNALSPDGSRVAGHAGRAVISIYGPQGGADRIDASGYVLGWLDDHHIVIQQIDTPTLSVLEVTESPPMSARRWTIRSADISAGGAYLGNLPGALT